MARVNNVGYVERRKRSAAARPSVAARIPYTDIFIVRPMSGCSSGYVSLGSQSKGTKMNIFFPASYIGHHVRLRVEIVLMKDSSDS